MYGVTAAGLGLFWMRRKHLGAGNASSAIAGGSLLGFGGWNVADVVVFHWAMGIHRIRVNVENPMTYDVAWLAILGLVPLLAGLLVLRQRPPTSSGRIMASLLVLSTVGTGTLASLPARGQQSTLVLTTSDRSIPVLNAALASGAGLALFDRDAGIIVLVGANDAVSNEAYRHGALIVTRSPALAGCAAAIA
jgi:hypothetical protein